MKSAGMKMTVTILIAGSVLASLAAFGSPIAQADDGAPSELTQPDWKAASWKASWESWNSAAMQAAWGQWDWSAGNAWNTGNELKVLPSPDGRLAATQHWEDESGLMKVEVWDAERQELLTTVGSTEELRSWMKSQWNSKSQWNQNQWSQQWRSWTEQAGSAEW